MLIASDKELRDITNTIVESVDPVRIILFGSYARGTAGPHSDLDLLIVEDAEFGPGRSRRVEMAKIWRLLAPFPTPKDILVYDRREVESLSQTKNHVVARALREGKVLHERSTQVEAGRHAAAIHLHSSDPAEAHTKSPLILKKRGDDDG